MVEKGYGLLAFFQSEEIDLEAKEMARKLWNLGHLFDSRKIYKKRAKEKGKKFKTRKKLNKIELSIKNLCDELGIECYNASLWLKAIAGPPTLIQMDSFTPIPLMESISC